MTTQQIEERNFTYCSAYYGGCVFHKFLVGTPSRPEARRQAAAYAESMWGIPELIHVYPRKYIKEARVLLAAGRHN